MSTTRDFSDCNSIPSAHAHSHSHVCAAFQLFLCGALEMMTALAWYNGQQRVSPKAEANSQMSMAGKSCEVWNRGCRAHVGEDLSMIMIVWMCTLANSGDIIFAPADIHNVNSRCVARKIAL